MLQSGFESPPRCLDLAAFGPQSAASMNADSSQPKPTGQVARDQRRAAALRENLRRRKSQARARASEASGTDKMGADEGADAPSTGRARESEP